MLKVPERPITTEGQNVNVDQHTPAPSPVTNPGAQGYKVIYQKQNQVPEWIFFGCVVVLVAVLCYGVGFMMASSAQSANGSGASSSSGSSSMSMGSSSNVVTAAPDATQKYGDQLATYTRDADGAKHFTFTAQQVMWDVTGGHRVLAWTINGMVPGPRVEVNAGDHVRVTFINHFPTPTSVHWHGLTVPTQQDGVAGLGQKPIQVGQTFQYDFGITDQDVGTHWYHSHYDDMEQETNGFYGAFIVNPRPGTAAADAMRSDVAYDEFIATMGGYYVINGKSFPDTQPINVKHGQTVHLRVIGADSGLRHPMHLHGHTFSIVAEDGHALTQPVLKDTVQVAPGETYDLMFSADQAPGSVYPFHCHILSHLMNPGQNADEMGGLVSLVQYAK